MKCSSYRKSITDPSNQRRVSDFSACTPWNAPSRQFFNDHESSQWQLGKEALAGSELKSPDSERAETT